MLDRASLNVEAPVAHDTGSRRKADKERLIRVFFLGHGPSPRLCQLLLDGLIAIEVHDQVLIDFQFWLRLVHSPAWLRSRSSACRFLFLF